LLITKINLRRRKTVSTNGRRRTSAAVAEAVGHLGKIKYRHDFTT
jgi:hypothetical protein